MKLLYSLLSSVPFMFILITLCEAGRYHTMLLSDDSNKMFRCELRSLFYCAEINYSGNTIHAMDVHGTDVFAALEDHGILWRCNIDETHTCKVMYRANKPLKALALTKDTIFIGLSNEIMQCDASAADSCHTYLRTAATVNSLSTTTQHLFAALDNGEMLRCLRSEPSCLPFNKKENDPIISLAATEDQVFAGLKSGVIMTCSTWLAYSWSVFNSAGQPINTLDVYEGILYAGLQNGIIWKCDTNKPHACSTITTRPSKVNSLKIIPGASDDCAQGVKLPAGWHNLSLRNRTTVDFELNVTRNH